MSTEYQTRHRLPLKPHVKPDFKLNLPEVHGQMAHVTAFPVVPGTRVLRCHEAEHSSVEDGAASGTSRCSHRCETRPGRRLILKGVPACAGHLAGSCRERWGGMVQNERRIGAVQQHLPSLSTDLGHWVRWAFLRIDEQQRKRKGGPEHRVREGGCHAALSPPLRAAFLFCTFNMQLFNGVY